MERKLIYVIAEIGVNHNGSLELAKHLVDAAVEAQANAVKFQTFRAQELASVSAPQAEYQKKWMPITDSSQLAMLKALELSESQQIDLYQYCQGKRIDFLSSPFDFFSADFLINQLQVKRIKIASGEITNLPLLFKIAKTNTPVILSTGMSTLGEIETALSVLALGYLALDDKRMPEKESLNSAYFSSIGQILLREKVGLLHCTSAYPTPFSEVNLRAMQTLKNAFSLTTGFSDHTLGLTIPIAAAALGAEIIEKHLTLDRNMVGPDHNMSLQPEEFIQMVAAIRQVETALGDGRKIPMSGELETRLIARKSLVALEKIMQGEKLTEKNIGCKRPGYGLPPASFWEMQNKIAQRDYDKDEIIT